MSNPSKFGFEDPARAGRPTVYQPGLFAGQVVMVSGAGSGIGQAVASLYARLGANLVICGPDAAALDACADGLRRLGSPDLLVQPVSIGESEQVERLLDAAWGRFGRIDVLVNNAGAHAPQRSLDYSTSAWRAVINSNLNGTWYMMHAVARRWRDSDAAGNIVNVVATFQRGMPGAAPTCAASSAITYLSKTVAVEWAQYRIRVNCVAPAGIADSGSPAPPVNGGWAGANPMKRAGKPLDVAEAVVYLSAPSGEFVTGELLTVDGGGVLWGETWAGRKPDYYRLNP